MYVITLVAPYWQDLGIKLGIEIAKLNEIRRDYGINFSTACTAMF